MSGGKCQGGKCQGGEYKQVLFASLTISTRNPITNENSRSQIISLVFWPLTCTI